MQFFDKDDTLLGENSDGTDSLAPGQTWSFKVSGFPETLENQPITAVDYYLITAQDSSNNYRILFYSRPF